MVYLLLLWHQLTDVIYCYAIQVIVLVLHDDC